MTFHTGAPKPADQVTADTATHHTRRQAALDGITALLAAHDLTPDQLNLAVSDGGPLTPADRDTLARLQICGAALAGRCPATASDAI